MRIQPDIGLRELLESPFRPVQQLQPLWPSDRDLGPRRDRGWRSGVRDLRLIVDVIDPELDAMLDAPRLDDRHPGRVSFAANILAVEHVTHSENGL